MLELISWLANIINIIYILSIFIFVCYVIYQIFFIDKIIKRKNQERIIKIFAIIFILLFFYQIGLYVITMLNLIINERGGKG